MKRQTALKMLLLIAILFAAALVSHSGNSARHSGAYSASPLYPDQVKSKGIELARQGFQVGQG